MNKINAKEVRPNYVAIKGSTIVSDPEEIIQRTEEDKLKQARKQNVGVVVMIGRNCEDWIQEGDTVSFYRNAATPVPIPGETDEILLVHEDHILVKLP